MSQTGRVTEVEARAVAEAAREAAWAKPSFAKDLYLGHLRLDLIHPAPRTPTDKAARGEDFLKRLRAYCETLDGQVIERESRIPDEYAKGFAAIGAFGMKIPE